MPSRFDLKPEEVRTLAGQLGHRDLLVRPTRRSRFVCECSCGFISRSTLNVRFAAEEGIKHMENVVRTSSERGVPLPISSDTPIERTSESSHSQVA